ncbi:hypothetical protein JTB14_022453 [Gonioctena quinquepunctata]|nr:hypothetical protein JTB14_022453 [Gonioctena quinquepunctata]
MLAFENIKESLVSAPVLTCPNFEKPFIISTDASDFGLGAVLSQELDDGEHVISYISRSLSRSERKWTVTEKECTAVVFAKSFAHILRALTLKFIQIIIVLCG